MTSSYIAIQEAVNKGDNSKLQELIGMYCSSGKQRNVETLLDGQGENSLEFQNDYLAFNQGYLKNTIPKGGSKWLGGYFCTINAFLGIFLV